MKDLPNIGNVMLKNVMSVYMIGSELVYLHLMEIQKSTQRYATSFYNLSVIQKKAK